MPVSKLLILEMFSLTKFGGPVELARFPKLASWPPCTKAISLSAQKKPCLSR